MRTPQAPPLAMIRYEMRFMEEIGEAKPLAGPCQTTAKHPHSPRRALCGVPAPTQRAHLPVKAGNLPRA